MELRVEHEIAAPLERVEAAVLDAELMRRLPAYAPVLAGVVERARRDLGDRIEREAVYVAAIVPPPLAAVIPRAWATWIERTCWDLRAHAASFTIEPQIPRALRRRVTCAGRYALHALADGRTRRSVTGELRIDAPMLGRRVEATLARVIAEQFAGEAALLAALAAGAP